MCGCNTIFDIESSLKILDINLNPYQIKANNRLDELVKIFCLKCGANRQKPDHNSHNKGIFDFKVLKIKDSNDQNDNNKDPKNQKDKQKKIPKEKDNEEKDYVSKCDHVICQSCIEDFSRSVINKQNNLKSKNSKESKNNAENISKIYCNICEFEHNADMKPILNMMKKNPCCQGGCLIY